MPPMGGARGPEEDMTRIYEAKYRTAKKVGMVERCAEVDSQDSTKRIQRNRGVMHSRLVTGRWVHGEQTATPLRKRFGDNRAT